MAFRTIRYRLDPGTRARHMLMPGTAGACRFAWNRAVAKLREDYESGDKCEFSFFSLGVEFTKLRKSTPWLREYSPANVKTSLRQMETAWREFFRDQGGLPCFHARHKTAPGFPLADETRFQIAGDRLFVEKIGWMRIKGANLYPDAKPGSGRIKHEGGKWYACIVYEVPEKEVEIPANPVVAGLDGNVGQLALSTGK